MKKKLHILLLMLGLLTLLAGCGCKHDWDAATCTEPKTCSLCHKTEGAANGHEWNAATCNDPKKCIICGKTQGDALGHNWEPATCLVPEQCTRCHETQGAALDHNWAEATTEAPKTCTNCQATEGTKLVIDPRFTTASTKDFHGTWSCDIVFTGEMLGELMEDTTIDLDDTPVTVYYEFTNKGELIGTVVVHDQIAFIETIKKVSREFLLLTLKEEGISEDEADAAIQAAYGMTLDQYIDASVNSMDPDDLFDSMVYNGVYYVGQNGLYTGESWYGEFECDEYTLEGDTLTIKDASPVDEEDLVLSRVKA